MPYAFCKVKEEAMKAVSFCILVEIIYVNS